jgi:hypothetical protein
MNEFTNARNKGMYDKNTVFDENTVYDKNMMKDMLKEQQKFKSQFSTGQQNTSSSKGCLGGLLGTLSFVGGAASGFMHAKGIEITPDYWNDVIWSNDFSYNFKYYSGYSSRYYCWWRSRCNGF